MTVAFAGKTASTVADGAGSWRVILPPLHAGDSGVLTVTGNNRLTVGNVLVGSVWVGAGQSNAGMGMKLIANADAEIEDAHYPKIRLFCVMDGSSLEVRTDVTGHWVECSPDALRTNGAWGGFPAVSFLFAREIHKTTGLPVGIITATYGGTVAQSWTSLSGLRQVPELRCYAQQVDDLPKLTAKHARRRARYEKQLLTWQSDVNEPYQAGLKAWEKAAEDARADGRAEPEKPILDLPEPPEPGPPPDRDQNFPTALFNGMIAPLTHFAIEGVVWYQGETYSGLATEYRILFPALVRDWRRQWGQGDFPFLFVQLPNWDGSYLWAYTREGQAAALALPNTAMAVAIDAGAGRDVHVPNKQVVSHRLALAALKLVYGKKLVASGPIYDSMHVEGDRIRITFREVGSGLTFGDLLGKQPGLPPRPPSDRLKGFVIAGADNEGFPAKATIDGATVLVSIDRVPQPVAVRYAFEDNPDCNLYNQEGLPAAPFRTDDLPKARPADARPPTPVPAPVSPATAAVVSVHMAWNHDTTVPNGTLAGAPDPGRRVWNNLFAPGGNSLTEPTTRADNLLDSNGAATGINLALTGRNQAYRSETPDPNPVLLSYPGAGKYTAVLTGLDGSGGTLYDVYVYNHWYWGSSGVCVATTSIVEGIVPGDSENENIWDPGSLKYARLLREGVNYVVFRDVTPAAAGRIAVEADSSGGSLNSLQLVAHPKPR